MDRNKAIGKKVYEFIDKNYTFTPNKEKVYTITAVRPYDEVKDHYDHYVLTDDEGNTKEVRSYLVLFLPNTEVGQDEMISQYLSDNKIYGEVYTTNDGAVIVSISWGDWKHEHGWCRDLMRYIGYDEYDEIVTEDCGSDTYSSEHYFQKAIA